MPPRLVRTTAQKRTFLETKWRQIPPHTGQLRARTLLLLNACPTSNPKDATPWAAWTEFPNPTSVANSRWGQQPLLNYQKHRETTAYGVSSGDAGGRYIRRPTSPAAVPSPRAATQPPRRPAEFSSCDVACHATLRLGGHSCMGNNTTLPSRGAADREPQQYPSRETARRRSRACTPACLPRKLSASRGSSKRVALLRQERAA
jgi:hypothetical protein